MAGDAVQWHVECMKHGLSDLKCMEVAIRASRAWTE